MRLRREQFRQMMKTDSKEGLILLLHRTLKTLQAKYHFMDNVHLRDRELDIYDELYDRGITYGEALDLVEDEEYINKLKLIKKMMR